ncbi:MAG: hypothetical protein EOP00_27600 [Pedobacter sp.]|nr:MAG: hypothetical protein EOP00_27600 [Pedobacter sp.]
METKELKKKKVSYDDERRLRINGTLEELSRRKFKKVIDECRSFAQDDPIYYKYLKGNQYLIINHYCHKYAIKFQGFDCFIAQFKSENEIGKKKPIDTLTLMLSFYFDRDGVMVDSLINHR